LGRALADSQDRTVSAHELADHQEAFGGARADAGAPVPHRQVGSVQATIGERLEKDARASAAVIEQRLRPLGYGGGHSILREYIHKVRPQPQSKRAFVGMEPEASDRFEVDRGHFGTHHYEGERRKVYAFALVGAHSRM
jgi:transposase